MIKYSKTKLESAERELSKINMLFLDSLPPEEKTELLEGIGIVIKYAEKYGGDDGHV